MQCEMCQKNEATIHLTEITDGVRVEAHLCQKCAAEQGVAMKGQVPINELLSSLLSVQPSDEELAGIAGKEVVCSNCGITLEQFQKEAVLGCPQDYTVFESSLKPLIAKAHNGNTSHCGKVPSKAPKDTKVQMELMKMRQDLEAAIKGENYELAAKLRDKIDASAKS